MPASVTTSDKLMEAMGGAGSFKELTAAFQEVISSLGFYAFTLGRAPIQRGQVDTTEVAFFTTLEDKVEAEYRSKKFEAFDPVFEMMATRFLPFSKSSIEPEFDATPDKAEIVRMSENHNLGDALMIPVSTTDCCRGVVLFTHASAEEFRKMRTHHEPGLHYSSFHLFARAEALGFGALAPSDKLLSHRETECLQYLAQGKTNDEISSSLGISERTVRFHIANACEKLGTDRRSKAVTMAIQKGLIRT